MNQWKGKRERGKRKIQGEPNGREKEAWMAWRKRMRKTEGGRQSKKIRKEGRDRRMSEIRTEGRRKGVK